MGNPFAHVEIGTRDMAKASGFYKKVFDWKIDATPMGEGETYDLIDTGTPPGGGIFVPAPEVPVGVTVYIQVNNIEETLGKIEGAGGKTVMPKQEVPEEGWFALFSDLDGNVLGLWESKPA
ncbi:MAG: VOC family protein [Anaerolineae bacterium]